MLVIFSHLLLVVAALLAIPVAVLFFEIIAAITLTREDRSVRSGHNYRPRVAVLVPAHNESAGLQPTIADIKPQLRGGDRLLVVADNCSDDTAAVAAAAGAEVIERKDLCKIGKGYALDWGFRHLSADVPEIVIIIDADCRVAVGTIDRLTTVCALTHRPVQALDLMTAPDQSPINYQVAEFAWRVKNWVRPLGLKALNLPCQLMGTGMALPWEQICSINLASGQIVEDLKLGLDLTVAGRAPLFCPSAVVTSQFPSSNEGASTQRQRWERGHVGMILKVAPRLICLALARRNMDLFAIALDMAVPPLSLLALLTIGTGTIAAVASLFGFSSAALIISATSFTALLTSVFLCWLKYGRDILPPRALVAVAPFILAKLHLYRRLLLRGVPQHWSRTDRN